MDWQLLSEVWGGAIRFGGFNVPACPCRPVYESVAEPIPAADRGLAVDKDPLQDQPLADQALEQWQHALATSSSLPLGGSMLKPSKDLPRKALPPGTAKQHWWTFRATPGCGTTSSYTTFKRVWREHFKPILCFRKWGTHSTCSTCSRLQAQMRGAEDLAEKLRWAHLYREHLRAQWRDRLRELGQSLDGQWLVLIVDGADQAKFRIVKAQRWPKELDGMHRPKLQLVGAWAHWQLCTFTLREENLPKGTSCIMEVVLQLLAQLLQDKGTLPANLWLQMDNAVGENKNQWWARLLALLIDRGVFRTCVWSFLRVGHTHEDLDGLFGVLAMHIASLQEWNAPMEMQACPWQQ